MSWFYRKDAERFSAEATVLGCPVFVDCGGFSAASHGERLSLADYIRWLRERPKLTQYASMDIIGDWRATARNHEIMLANGLNPLPVWHIGSPMAELRRLAAAYGRVAVGGIVPWLRRRPELERILDDAWRVLEGTRVHAFGLTAWDLVLRYPWASVDSSTWVSSIPHGQVRLFDEQRGRWATIDMRIRRELERNMHIFRAHGVAVRDIMISGRLSLPHAYAWSYALASRWLQEHYGRDVTFWLAGSGYRLPEVVSHHQEMTARRGW